MTTDPIIIFIESERWRLGLPSSAGLGIKSIEIADPSNPVEAVAGVREAMASAGVVSETIVLALGSASCLSAAINTQNLDRGNRRQALSFRLEEQLPIAAEQIVADYYEQGGAALGVCAELETLGPTVGAFEAEDFTVEHICPAAMLAGQQLVAMDRDLDGVLICGEGGACEVIELDRGRPIRWMWFADDRDSMKRHVESLAAESDQPIRLARVGGEANDSWRPERVEWIDREEDPTELAARMAQALASGESSPWFDFRQDALAKPDRLQPYRRSLTALALAVVLLMVSLIVVMQWRGREYQSIAGDYRQQETDVFRTAFPGQQRVPTNIPGRFRSETRKLEGLGGQAAGDVDPSKLRTESALAQLHTILAALPSGLRYRFVDLTIDPDAVTIGGEVRSISDAEQLASAIRNSGWFEVDPPTTEALSGRGYSFSFTARPSVAGGSARVVRP